jgi:tight adherence protein B
MILGEMPHSTQLFLNSIVIFIAVAGAVWLGLNPLRELLIRREDFYRQVLCNTLLLDIPPRVVTVLTTMVMVLLGSIAFVVLDGSIIATLLAAGIGFVLPRTIINLLRKRRLEKLESQLVGCIQTLASGVRAGLNLVQAMEMVANDGAPPIRQEFRHMLREYEYGVPLDEAMSKASVRIGSGDFTLLFMALETHRQRGGDLGTTLDRITDSIREIQRLENRVDTLTAQGRATARWLGAMPGVVMGILYLIDPNGVQSMLNASAGKIILLTIVLLNIVGFLWIRKIIAIDI